MDAAKRKGQRVLYKITKVTGMRKRLAAVKDKVDKAIDSMENLEKAVEECRGRQRETGQEISAVENCMMAEPQGEYGAELFEQYQREQGVRQTVRAVGQIVTQEVEKSR